jgi:hypothetical protein
MNMVNRRLVHSLVIRSLLEKEKLNGANFLNWYHNLRIVLRQEKIEYVLTVPYPKDLPAGLSAADHKADEKRCDDALNMSCLMPATMSHVDTYTMI